MKPSHRIIPACALLLALLVACGGPTNQPPEQEPPTEIAGNMGIADAEGTVVYVGGASPEEDQVAYVGELDSSGGFHFALNSTPDNMATYTCNGITFSGAAIFAAWIAWDGLLDGTIDPPPRQFTVATLRTTPGGNTFVTWVYSPVPQALPTSCDAGSDSIDLPAGWSAVTFLTSPDRYGALLPTVPATAAWTVTEMCIPMCPAATKAD